ncbi:hypothetical protein N7466_009664 [Penicillium verhagenii]|uniref:uncharacterized protein n=1 Tax=Penicillium verhagenii TaxID=1562060 RepID=UPI002545352E|nr:uncharacterized protein N7466_009664 [Penicillium verhagenii]KAJ5921338.1 hypothetical protein N7466_009664 [Penicillium verhagenii]
MYAKYCLSLLAASWLVLGSLPVGADQIFAVRDTCCGSSSDDTPPAPAPVNSPSSAPAPSSPGICPLASALCAACPVSTTTLTIISCPSASAGPSPERSSSAPASPASSSRSAAPSFSNRTTTASAPSSVPLIRSSTPLVHSTSAAVAGSGPPALPTSSAAAGAGASGAGSGAGSAVTPRAVLLPAVVRRQLMGVGVMNVTAPFANTSTLTNTTIHNATSFLTSSTATEATGFRFHIRNRL